MANETRTSGENARPRAQGRPSLSEAEAIGRSLRDAAMQALLDHGDAATMNGIARAAGVSRKALYARYSSRSELFAEVIRGSLGEAEPLPISGEGDVFEQLERFIADVLQMLDKPQSRAVQRLIALDPYYLGSLRNELQQAAATMFFEPLRRLVEQGVREGAIRPGDPAVIARVVMRMIFAQGLFSGEKGAEEPALPPDGEGARLVCDIILRGLRADRTAG